MGSTGTTLVCYAIAVIIAIGILSYAGTAQIQALERQVKNDLEGDVRAVASETGSRMSAVASVMEVTAKLPQVKDTSDAGLVSAENKGVPEDAAVEKRQVAKDILASNSDIDAIGFILANGDMYLEEPYSRQQNLTRTNFVSRDYFQGAIAAGGAYLGEVYISAATGASAAALAVPVYNDDKTLAGVWIAVMNLQALNSRADEALGSEYGGRVVYIDQNNHEVVSSSALVSADETLSDLQSYSDALAGESGSRVEMKDGVEMYVAYSPVQMPGATWVILAMQPYSEAFSPAPALQLQGSIIAASAVAAGLGFVVYRSAAKGQKT
jgi:cache domain-containing protein